MRGATSVRPRPAPFRDISIHAPREGCDTLRDHARRPREISIHAPREGCDVPIVILAVFYGIFQSTHPVRGATRDGASVTRLGRFQSTHPVRGATNAASNCSTISIISIHAPREGCDRHQDSRRHGKTSFQSTHPVRGATISRKLLIASRLISIHAPREGCDASCAIPSGMESDFNPRTP